MRLERLEKGPGMGSRVDELKIVIIAGPNGAGKTTFASQFLPNEGKCTTFINADLIAAGISPFAPELVSARAGRLMLEEIEAQVKNRKSFAFETTLSGRAYLHKIREWRGLGYHIKMIFLSLPDADVAVARVAARVAQGGHNIPENVIRRRFEHGLRNFRFLYQFEVDAWVLYDNSSTVPVFLELGGK